MAERNIKPRKISGQEKNDTRIDRTKYRNLILSGLSLRTIWVRAKTNRRNPLLSASLPFVALTGKGDLFFRKHILPLTLQVVRGLKNAPENAQGALYSLFACPVAVLTTSRLKNTELAPLQGREA